MSLYRRFPSHGQPSFITTNTHQRQPIFLNGPACHLLCDVIYQVRREAPFQLLAFSVMPDHLHLILATDAPLGCTVQLIKGRFARLHNVNTGDVGSVWQTRYHERILASEAALSAAVEYVHNNPVAARLCDLPEHYAWSTAAGNFESDLEAFLSG
jgi:REP element-mobilizing transposase RayT